MRSRHQAMLPFLREAGRVILRRSWLFPRTSSSHQPADASQHAHAGYWQLGYCCWSSAAVNVARLDNNYNHINNSNINKSSYKQQTANSGSVSRRRLICTSLVLAPFSKVPEPRQQHSVVWGPQQHQGSRRGLHFSTPLELLANKEAGKSDHSNYFSTRSTHCKNSAGLQKGLYWFSLPVKWAHCKYCLIHE